jgi:hypothetical protein
MRNDPGTNKKYREFLAGIYPLPNGFTKLTFLVVERSTLAEKQTSMMKLITKKGTAYNLHS